VSTLKGPVGWWTLCRTFSGVYHVQENSRTKQDRSYSDLFHTSSGNRCSTVCPVRHQCRPLSRHSMHTLAYHLPSQTHCPLSRRSSAVRRAPNTVCMPYSHADAENIEQNRPSPLEIPSAASHFFPFLFFTPCASPGPSASTRTASSSLLFFLGAVPMGLLSPSNSFMKSDCIPARRPSHHAFSASSCDCISATRCFRRLF